MTRQLYTKLSVWVVCLVIPFYLSAQDIHYTNFGYSPLNISPALTGMFPGDYRAGLSFRNQWQNVPVSYNTFLAAFDAKLGNHEKAQQPWRVGAVVSYDQAGYSQLSNSSIYMTGAYLKGLSKKDFLSAGIALGFNQRAFKTGDLTWDDQYFERQFNSNIISADAAIFDERISYPDLSAGLNYHHQKPGKRASLDIGGGYFHINNPKRNFRSEPSVRLEARYTGYFMANIEMSRYFDLLVEGLAQWQGPHRQFLGTVGGRLYLVEKRTEVFALSAGVSIRGIDAFSPNIGLIYNRWKVAVNFDSNFSPFTAATRRVGGPEINVVYIFTKVPPARYCPLCPVYL